jgi:hypothetical protein
MINKSIKKKNSLRFNTKKVFKKKITKNTNFIGAGLDLIFGLIYLAKKYKNFDIPLKFNKKYGYKRDDFMNYGIRFDCEYYEKKQKLIFPIYDNLFFDLIKNNKKRFVGIFLYIKWDCANNDAHFNAILFDTKMKTVERFEPYTKFLEKKYFNVTNKFDIQFKKIIKKYLDYEYIKPQNFCPSLGFQQKEENNLLSVSTKRTIGNYELNNDPGGFCGAWSIYFLNLRISNPNIDTKIILKNIYNYLEKDKHSFRSFIRNYSNFIYKERAKLLRNYNKKSDDDYYELHTFLEDRFSKLIDRT